MMAGTKSREYRRLIRKVSYEGLLCFTHSFDCLCRRLNVGAAAAGRHSSVYHVAAKFLERQLESVIDCGATESCESWSVSVRQSGFSSVSSVKWP
ncbi:hypothetical protein E2C01_040266 [Portunus trituberculatus]|uniref:Uncharacterized protein n=1 Tax=Portunus trituberculatus TaxID=210409 RepID=A0A5B7FM33_PORTR|nr:hypothetical protein [Portunus trituberculatus]